MELRFAVSGYRVYRETYEDITMHTSEYACFFLIIHFREYDKGARGFGPQFWKGYVRRYRSQKTPSSLESQ